MKIRDLRITRFKMTRLDPTWRTASYASSGVDGFIVELIADDAIGIGATAAHPHSLPAEKIEAQLNGPIREVLIGAEALGQWPMQGFKAQH